MYKIQLLTRLAGPEGNFNPGAILELEQEKAEALINGGYALLIEKPKIEIKEEISQEVKEEVKQEIKPKKAR